MNSELPDLPELPAAETSEAAPPKRRARKPAAEATGADVPELSGSGDGVGEPALPVAVPRKTRARKPAAGHGDGLAAHESHETGLTGTAIETGPIPASLVAVDAASGVESGAGGERAAHPGGDSGSAPGPDSVTPAAQGERRNRRRGRRGGAASRNEGRIDGAVAGTGSDQADALEGQAPPLAPPVPDVGEVFASLLAGEFDGQDDDEPEIEEGVEKRVLLPDPDAPKLHKVLAQSGVGSRRDMEQMILEGRVNVNDEVAHTGMRISFGDRITIDGKPVRVRIAPPPARVIAYHKPVGEVVTHDDPQQRPTVFRKLPRLAQGKWQSVGRLDINTEGLLLFTNSGDLANKLMHPRFGVEREYAVRVLGTLEKPAKERLLAGVEIEGQTAAFVSVEDGGGEGVNHWYRVVITEGRNREVRRLFEAVGLTVSRLIRIRYGCVVLPRGLKRGACVDLGEDNVKALRHLTGSAPAGQRPERRGDGRDTRPEGRFERRPDGRADTRGDSRRDAPPDQRGQARSEGRGEPRQDLARGAKPPRGPQGSQGDRRQAQAERPPRDDGGRAHGPRREREASDIAPPELREPGDPSRIPNPLQQTYDKRAIQRERAGTRNEDEFENGPIPNPLQQTYDKRFVQNTRSGGGGAGGQRGRGGKPGKGGEPRQPDPMQTAVGYIGADAFTRKSGGRGGGGGGGRRGGR